MRVEDPNPPPEREAARRVAGSDRASRLRAARGSRRGAVIVEYALLLTAFAIPAMMGIVAGGVAMMKEYQEARAHLLRPFP